MHPLIRRARPAQDRARLICDAALGPLDLPAPEITDQSDRYALEYAARAEARDLLRDDTVRTWLADTEQTTRAQRLDTAAAQLGTVALTASRDQHTESKGRPKPTPELIERLHALLTLADLATTTPITVADHPTIGDTIRQ